MVLSFLFDIIFFRNTSLGFALIANPYVSGIIMYFSLFREYVFRKSIKLKFNVRFLCVFFTSIILVIIGYFSKHLDLRTVTQLSQFFLIFASICFVVFSNKNFICEPNKKIISLMFSTMLICLIKFSSVFIGISNFNMNGQNEDSFLIVIIGCICGFLYYRKITFSAVLYFLIITLALFFYASRAAQAMAFVSCIAYFVAVFTKFNINKMIFWFVAFLIVLLMFLFTIDGVQVYVAANTDMERNHSNIERMAMYIYTYDFLLSSFESYGLGNVGLAMNDMRTAGVISGEYPHPHSSYLRFSLEFGFIGLIGICLLYFMLLIKSVKMYTFAPREGIIFIIAIVNLIVFSFVGSIFFSFYRASAVILSLSLILSVYKNNRMPCI